MIEIDGSYGEGGGQILRTSLAFSLVTGKPFIIKKIRASRPKPGLMPQHLKCVEACVDFSGSECKDAKIGAQSFSFYPGKRKRKSITIDIGTAGSVTLLLQSLLLPALMSGNKTRIKVTGGTDVKWSMPVDYFTYVLSPFIRNYADIRTKLVKRGYFPKGDGEFIVLIEKKEDISPIDIIEKEDLKMIKGISHACTDLSKQRVAKRQASAASIFLKNRGFDNDIGVEYSNSTCPGSGITLWGVYSKSEVDSTFPLITGSDALGEKGKTSEKVGEQAAERLVKNMESSAPVDEFTSDNLIPFIALFGGSVKVPELTGHILSNIYVVEKFLGKCISVDRNNNVIKKI